MSDLYRTYKHFSVEKMPDEIRKAVELLCCLECYKESQECFSILVHEFESLDGMEFSSLEELAEEHDFALQQIVSNWLLESGAEALETVYIDL